MRPPDTVDSVGGRPFSHKMIMRNKLIMVLLAVAPTIMAQEAVTVGRASYAAYPPTYKGATDEHGGFNATRVMTRKLYADETLPDGTARPIPTNDWWTDVMVSRYSGALWSYPAMLRTSAEGVTVCYPTHWNDNGTEVKSDTWLRVQGRDFEAAETRAADWHDWDVKITLPDTSGKGSVNATLAHGIPFTWFEFDRVTPEIIFSDTPTLLARTDAGMSLRVGNDLYALYFDAGAEVGDADGGMRLEGTRWLSVALLTAEDDFEKFAPYAPSVVRDTRVSWHYDETRSLLSTEWHVEAENLRTQGAEAPVMQGFLPHSYKYAVQSDLTYNGTSYLTPRGELRMAVADNGQFAYSYRFAGMLPYYAAPQAGTSIGYRPEVMRQLIERYADGGSFGDDTYWGGKGLTQMALNMTFAKETGDTELYERSKARLRQVLVDWLTYTPGEETKFFAYYPRWGGMLGYDVSYDSDAFNDHHFHYGYFIYAAALLCLEDESFKEGYGELLRMIVKDYANYDRTDTRFPFLRTIDPWAGHSYAGGMGDNANDNGNGQESSSEAMQGWGGVYMLGVALGDSEMRDAGLFGWLTESRGTAEYWFDRDHIHPGRQHNYDYTRYASPYNTNLTSKGIGWWTWFSGDPLWMHSIQWMPVSPCLNYLSEDLDFVKWDYETMRDNSAYGWFQGSGSDGPLADQSVGNVVLCYMERYDPEGAAAVFDRALEQNLGIARNVDTGHISYYVIHSHLTHGDLDFDVTADTPTANAYRRADGTMTYMVYNPDEATRTVRFARDGVTEREVRAPGKRLSVFTDEARAAALTVSGRYGVIVPPGGSMPLVVTLLDQYGAELDCASVTLAVTGEATLTDGVLTVKSTARKGSQVTVTATDGNLTGKQVFTVNDLPRTVSAAITGIPDFVETGATLTLGLELTDQYGTVESPAKTAWSVTDADNAVVEAEGGVVTFTHAGLYDVRAVGGDAEAEAVVKVLPLLPNIALKGTATAGSCENDGLKAQFAIDGNSGTRWGSKHNDDDWLMIDLGADYRISAVDIVWEAAYAADYDIEVARADAPTDFSVVDSTRGNHGAGSVTHDVDVVARYVRVHCMRRGTVYGYSIIEMAVRGVPADVTDSSLVGLEIVGPAHMAEGESAQLAAAGYNFAGKRVTVFGTQWSVDRAGEMRGSTFVPTTYGRHTVTAATYGMTATHHILVDESIKLKSLEVAPAHLSLLTGETAKIAVTGKNQFGGMFEVNPEALSVSVADADGNDAGDALSFDGRTGIVTANKRGDYIMSFDGTAGVVVSVRDVSEANLAAGKRARASSVVGANTADKAVDNDRTTRWESRFDDDEWIAVDLGDTFMLNRVVIDWEGAYARRYDIMTSLDGETWLPAASVADGHGGVETLSLPDVVARHVRVNCLTRATGYGNSIYELQVYGSHRVDGVDDVSDSDAEGDLYDLDGRLLMRGVTIEQARRHLPEGIYIHANRIIRL